jgi:uracil-DNA glycosylase family 4
MQADAEKAAILLEWYRAMGVDEAIADAPADWFTGVPPAPVIQQLEITPSPLPPRRAAFSPPPQSTAAVPPSPMKSPAAPGEVMAARELARSATSLAELRALLEGFDGCGLKKTAARLCLARGSADARIMFVGEAPGKEEDAQGVPFVGRAGALLDRMLAAIGLGGDDVYITNLVYWRPPGNRTPSPEEVQVCLPFLERQIELVDPEILVFLGNAAAKQLTGATEGIIKLRGKWLTYTPPGLSDGSTRLPRPIRAIATLHPAYLLRTPIAKRLAWRDLLLIREALDSNGEAASPLELQRH